MASKGDLLKLIRRNCSECMGGPRAMEGVYPPPNPGDIASCTAPECAFFVYRFGKDPKKSKKGFASRRINEQK